MSKKATNFLELMESKYGEGIMENMNDGIVYSIPVIPTGSTSLDVAIGVGGIPKGRFTEIFGPESSGKTTLCLSICKNALKNGDRILYVEPENNLTPDFIKSMIGDYEKDQFIFAQPETAEQAMQICEAGIQSKEFGLIILDSIGALAPQAEKDKDLGEATVAVTARLLTQFLRRNAFAVRSQHLAFVFINQVRAKIGSYMGGYDTPGGNALRHYLVLRIQLSKIQDIKSGDAVIGIVSKFVTKKNKLAAPFRPGTFPIIFGSGIDTIRDTVEFAKTMGVLTLRGSYYVYKGEMLGQGVVKTMEYLNQHPDVLKTIYDECTVTVQDNTAKVVEEQLEEEDDSIENIDS
jgi:recombination protein RecA